MTRFEKLKMLGSGNEEMCTLLGLNQIQLEKFCRFIDRGLTEGLFKFPKIKDSIKKLNINY